jgi:hypothetical protein
MFALTQIERVIFTWPRWRFLMLLAAVMVVKTGVWHIPNLDSSIRIAQNPFILWEHRPSEQYIFTSWLSPFIAWAIGARHEALFLLLHLGYAIAFSALVTLLAFSRLDEAQARVSMIVFAVLPVSAQAYFWVGNDGLTLLLFASALASGGRPTLAGLIGIAIGLQHFEQGLFAFSALMVASYATTRFGGSAIFPWRTAAAILVGIVVGKLALTLIFHFAGMAIVGRQGWLAEYFTTHLGQFWFRGQYMVWSALGLGWLVALRFADNGRSSLSFFVCLIGLMPLMLIVNDQTRVIANVTFPLLFAFWLANPQFLGSVERREAAALLTLWFVVPWAWVFAGNPTWSVLPYDIVYGLNKLFGWFTVPDTFVSMWPFGDRR